MGCGAGLAQTPLAPTGMRFVTVAFCDISGSTQLALRFDPQVWHAILEAYFAEVGGALVAAGGRLEKFIGDAVVGVFGADRAGVDDAENALRGSLAALDRLRARNDETIAATESGSPSGSASPPGWSSWPTGIPPSPSVR